MDHHQHPSYHIYDIEIHNLLTNTSSDHLSLFLNVGFIQESGQSLPVGLHVFEQNTRSSSIGYALALISETCMLYSQIFWLIQLHMCPSDGEKIILIYACVAHFIFSSPVVYGTLVFFLITTVLMLPLMFTTICHLAVGHTLSLILTSCLLL